jgi:hypothetical protein
MSTTVEVRRGERMLRYDHDTGEWQLCVGGPGNPIIRSKNKTELERWLDWLDNKERKRGRINGTENRRVR